MLSPNMWKHRNVIPRSKVVHRVVLCWRHSAMWQVNTDIGSGNTPVSRSMSIVPKTWYLANRIGWDEDAWTS